MALEELGCQGSWWVDLGRRLGRTGNALGTLLIVSGQAPGVGSRGSLNPRVNKAYQLPPLARAPVGPEI